MKHAVTPDPARVVPEVLEIEHRPLPVSRVRLYILIGLMIVMWTANFLIAKVAVREFPVLGLSGLRLFVAALLLAVIFTWKHGWREFAVLRRDWRLLAVLATFGVIFNQVFFVAGIKNTTVAHASLIISLSPVFVLILARIHGLEPLTALKVAGMAISLAGVALLATERPAASAPTWKGDLFAILGSLGFAYFVILGKEVTPRYDSLSLNTFMFIIGAAAMLPVTVSSLAGMELARVSWKAWTAMFYMAAAASVAAYLIFYYALRFISATRMTALSYLQPALATLLSFFLLREPISFRLLLGAAVIFVGVYLTEKG